jgi:hypothetical protein
MGYRTVVILYNDQASEWANDPKLGQKISHAANFAYPMTNPAYGRPDFGTGQVLECVHGDTRTLVMLDSYRGVHLASNHWGYGDNNRSDNEVALPILREAAEKLGYRLVKKTVKR